MPNDAGEPSASEIAGRIRTDAEAMFAAIMQRIGDREIKQLSVNLQDAFSLGRLVTGWRGASSLPLSDSLVAEFRDLLEAHPAAAASELRRCEPLLARALVPDPRTVEEVCALARGIEVARASWVAGLLLSTCLHALVLHSPDRVSIGLPVIDRDQACAALLQALLRSNFDVGLALGLDIVATDLLGASLLERSCGDRFESMFLQACRLVARHPAGPRRLRERLLGRRRTRPPMGLVYVGVRCSAPVARELRNAFLEEFAASLDDEERSSFLEGAHDRPGQLLVSAAVYAVAESFAEESNWWWEERWNRYSRTFTAWPRPRSARDRTRLLTLAALGMAACHTRAGDNRREAEQALVGVLDRAAEVVGDLILAADPATFGTHVCAQLVGRGLQFAATVPGLADRVSSLRSDFVRSLRTSALVDSARRIALTLGDQALIADLDAASPGIRDFEIAMGIAQNATPDQGGGG